MEMYHCASPGYFSSTRIVLVGSWGSTTSTRRSSSPGRDARAAETRSRTTVTMMRAILSGMDTSLRDHSRLDTLLRNRLQSEEKLGQGACYQILILVNDIP